ncbi:hypothetical protein NDU88_007502 [Pleurodeles waltl]|uniref:Uncharacterized protein n=1 Tax=Pleurodeles waltl TaxID=8319 RepID=A0AAV7N6I7_PLEWA|nr:hypothetical protein NDU88_007502 [Pleurodeles waltl]
MYDLHGPSLPPQVALQQQAAPRSPSAPNRPRQKEKALQSQGGRLRHNTAAEQAPPRLFNERSPWSPPGLPGNRATVSALARRLRPCRAPRGPISPSRAADLPPFMAARGQRRPQAPPATSPLGQLRPGRVNA